MAGSSADFDAATFRADIRSAMVMGLPQSVDLRPTFLFEPHPTFVIADPAGEPYDWTETPAANTPRLPARVPCVVKFRGASEQLTTAGQADVVEAELTLLDVDYAKVVGFSAVLLGGDRYLPRRELQPTGLFEVTVHNIIVEATGIA